MANQLPGVAGQIEELIGLELTVKLLQERGGTRVKIPVNAKGTLLAGIIGDKATEILIKDLGHGNLNLPCSHMRGQAGRKRQAMAMLRDGKSQRVVALECDLHERTVANYTAEIEDDSQGDLFDL